MELQTYSQIIATTMPKGGPSNRVFISSSASSESYAEASRSGFLDLNLNAIIEKKVKEAVDAVLNAQGVVDFRKISLKQAEVEVFEYLKQCLARGSEAVNLFDISFGLRLPGEQVEKVMSLLSKSGKVKEL